MRDIVVFGPTGAGKSSFIKRYLIPALNAKGAQAIVKDLPEVRVRPDGRVEKNRVYQEPTEYPGDKHVVVYETAISSMYETRIPNSIKFAIPRHRRPFLVFLNPPKEQCFQNNQARLKYNLPVYVMNEAMQYDMIGVESVVKAAGVPMLRTDDISDSSLKALTEAVVAKAVT
jgi:hypothetical protein